MLSEFQSSDSESHGNKSDRLNTSLTRISRESSVISIWGERGSGKSTLLSHCLQKFSEDSTYIVLPPISPELFGPHDTLLNVALAALHDHIERNLSIDQNDRLRLIKAVQRARRNAALNAVPLDHLLTASTSAISFARELQEVAGSTESLYFDLQQLISEVTTLCNASAIIIAVDDADMAHQGTIPSLITAIRNIGSLQNTILLVAGNRNDFSDRLFAELNPAHLYPDALLAQYNRHMDHLQTQVDAQLFKTFPKWAALDIPKVSYSDRLRYRPDSDQGTIVDLTAIALINNSQDHQSVVPTVREFCIEEDQLRDLLNETLFHAPLPSNLRMLHQHYSRLKIIQHYPQPRRLAEILTFLAQSISRPFASDAKLSFSFTVDVDRMRSYVLFSGVFKVIRSQGYRITPLLNSSTDNHSAASNTLQPSAELRLRPIVGTSSRWKSTNADGAVNDNSSGCEYALAIQGILLSHETVVIDATSQFAYGLDDSDYHFLQEFRVASSTTDDRILQFPLAPSLVSTLRVTHAWNTLVEFSTARSLTIKEVLALSIHAVIDIFIQQQTFDPSCHTTDYDSALDQAHQHAKAALHDLDGLTSSESLRAHYLGWYQRFLPSHWHEALFNEDQIRRFCREMVRISGGTDPVDHPSDRYSRFSLGARVRKHASEMGRSSESLAEAAWVAGYATVVEEFKIDVPATWNIFRREWNRLVSTQLFGNSAIETSLSGNGTSAAGLTVPISDDPAAPSTKPSGNRALTDFTIARLRAWAKADI